MITRKMLASFLLGAALASAAALTLHAATAPTPKGYVLGEFNVIDAEGFKPYGAAVPPIIAKFGGVYLARGGRTVPVEGTPPGQRVVIVEFPSLAAAKAFEDSGEYRAIAPIRQRATTGRLFIVEGTSP
jgi:uncharacterized protein (DUF1330 family)